MSTPTDPSLTPEHSDAPEGPGGDPSLINIGPPEFVEAIHGDALTPENRVVIFASGNHVQWCSSSEQAAQAATAFDAFDNTYMSCCLMDAAAEAPGRRGSAKDVVAMSAVWADIDVGTEGHKGKKYPPTIEEALAHLAHRIEQRPSIIVETGGGVHVWWLLDEPLTFDSAEARAEGAALSQRWQLRIREVWKEKGWDLDSTQDLARVLRLPGTHNHKHDPPRQVRITAWDLAARYAPTDLLENCPPLRAPVMASREMPTSDLIKKAMRARNGDAFKRLWEGDFTGYPSQSEADMALCKHLAFWAEGKSEQVERLFRESKLMRSKWDEQHGELTYGQRTIEAALDGMTEFYRQPTPPPKPLDDLLPCVDTLPEVIESDEAKEQLEEFLAEVALLPESVHTGMFSHIKERTGTPIGDLRRRVATLIRDEKQRSKQRNVRKSYNPDGCPYRATLNGFVYDKPTKDGPKTILLTNFTAHIVCTVIHDDGVEQRRSIEIDVQLKGHKHRCTVRAEEFSRMEWVMTHVGPGAVVYASAREHTRVAVQELSPEAPERVVYGHLGWREIKGIGWCYLHGGGAVGPLGLIQEVEVDLPGTLSNYTLPEPPEDQELLACVRGTFELLEMAPHRITIPLFAAIWRAALLACDFSLFLVGGTGIFKTAVAATFQAFWGAAFDDRHLPASWSSTGNALEMVSFLVKDAVLTIDDFAPTGARTAVQQMHTTAERVLRGQGNNAGRTRMTADAGLRSSRFARGLILSTGEDLPAGHSLRARTLFLSPNAGDVDVDRLTACQAAARAGVYAKALSGFLRHAAADYPSTRDRLRARAHELREQLHRSMLHRRVAAIEAELLAGLEVFLDFAAEVGAITEAEAQQHLALAKSTMNEVATAQVMYQRNADPAEEFLSLLSAALVAGEGHIEAREGGAPQSRPAEMLGWQSRPSSPASNGLAGYVSRGDRVGWLDSGDLYLDLAAAFRVAQRMSADSGGLSVTRHTLGKLLSDRGYLRSQEDKRQKHEVRKTIQGTRRYVLHLSVDTVLEGTDQAHQAQSGFGDESEAESGPTRSGDVGLDAADVSGAGPTALPDSPSPTQPDRGLEAGGPDGPDLGGEGGRDCA